MSVDLYVIHDGGHTVEWLVDAWPAGICPQYPGLHL